MTTTATNGELEAALRAALSGPVRFDDYSRALYATDASMYSITPLGVVFPRDADDVAAAVAVAGRFGVPVLPRGGGTSLAGQTVGAAVIVDCSMHMTGIAIDAEGRTATVQPGVVQDDLNRAAAREGLAFAADTSTSSRATLGGMIGNNSCGSLSIMYGSTLEHVVGLNVVLADATRTRFAAVGREEAARRARAETLEGRLYRDLPGLADRHGPAIAERFPFWRRNSGYGLDRIVDNGEVNLARLVTGSEGTLAAITEATVALVPRPAASHIAVGHFHSVAAAIAATADALDLAPAAVELIDEVILRLAKSKREYAALAGVLEGEPQALLYVTFYGESDADAEGLVARLAQRWQAHGHGYHTLRATTPETKGALLKVRKAGLGLLMAASTGTNRPLAFVEDTAVDPSVLPEYTERFAKILDRHGLEAGFYGHASVGCLHIRPFVDVAQPGQVATMRAVATEIRDLVGEFGGALSSEHGDGLVRSEFNRHLFGAQLYDVQRQVKGLFDPDNRMNPGKIVDAPAMTEHLRDAEPRRPLRLVTNFHFDDGLRGAADRCMRIGACRKTGEGVMCPSYMATRDEQHSTRGRANALVAALSAPDPRAALGDEKLHEILDLCLECKACKSECPLSVDMATMKSEFLAHYYARHGTPFGARVFGAVRHLYRLGARFAPLSNLPARVPPVRWLLERTAGLDRRRPLPRFERVTLPRWFARRPAREGPFPRGDVVLLADSFTSSTEPAIGRAAVELLERAGWRVRLESRVCCGRPQISKGLLRAARANAARTAAMLAPEARRGVPIVGFEPSCILTLGEEHLALLPGDPRAHAVAGQARLVEELLAEALDDGALALDAAAATRPQGGQGAVAGRRILFHGHCHQKALAGTAASVALLQRIPGADVVELDAGCCGMAGSFGFEADHYDLSMAIGGQRLFPAVNAEGPETLVAATGVSCRQQIAHGTGRRARHPVELLRDALVPGAQR